MNALKSPSMSPLSRKTIHAIEAVIYIALYHSTLPISGKILAETHGLTPRYLEQMMQKLVHAKLLRSIRGPRGGYVLAKERRRITLGDIVEVLQMDDPEQNTITYATKAGEVLISPICNSINSLIVDELRNYTLAQLCETAYSKELINHVLKDETSNHRRDFFDI